MSDPAIKTAQYPHQEEIYLKHRNTSFFGLFWEMGLGKSKTILDVASHNHAKGKIKALIIVAPNNVYKNWITQEIPKHLAAPRIAMPYPKKKTRKDSARKLVFIDTRTNTESLKVLCISFDSVRTKTGAEYLRKVMMLHETFLVVDESTEIKTHKTKIAKTLKSLGELAHMKWICTGTPVSESPFAIHSQIEFIYKHFWANHGMSNYSAFKNTFGEFKARVMGHRRFNELIKYKRLDYLNEIIKPISDRLLKDDACVKLPPKVYMTKTFEMHPEQLLLYTALKEDYTATIGDDYEVDAELAIVRLMRLQQITSGFITAEARSTQDDLQQSFEFIQGSACCEPEMLNIVTPTDNPRLQLLKETLDGLHHKVIVWCRFRRDIDIIVGMLGNQCVRYDGAVKNKDREAVLDAFRDPDSGAKVIVANVASLSHGVTLTIAKTMIYYSNSFSLERRLQSEDRFHRIGQDAKSVLIIDLAAEGSVDLHIIKALKSKYSIAAEVMGDKFRAWL